LKKYLVLIVLFVLPLVAYLFFASGINNFAKLPVLTENIEELELITKKEFNNKISILLFLGNDIENREGDALNLNQKIYKRFYQFKDFQFISISPLGNENKSKLLKEKLSSGTNTDMKNWSFIHLDKNKINELFSSLNTNLELDENLSSPYAYIIDKFSSLRGRDDSDGIKFGYDSRSVADINNNMLDDVKIILAEYRLALKKNNIFKEQ
jgi:glutathione peroxidase-family protein